MLSSRTKIIILIAGAVVVFGLIVATIFNLWPKQGAPLPGDGTGETNVDLSFLKSETTVQGREFDAGNRAAFEQAMGSLDKEAISPLEQEARSLAAFFVERFGTYSSDVDFANIDDLQSFMTPAMRGWAERFKKSQPESEGYSAIITEVASLAAKSFAPLERRAVFDIIANRTESKAGQSEVYQQKCVIELTQANSGAWLVASLYWGERL